jgi:hypothetical protein
VLKFLIILLIFASTACSTNTDKSKPKENEDSVTFVPKYLADPNNTLDAKVQKLELEYILWGCACANWITPEDYIKYQDSGLAQHCLFIEPADTTKLFPDSLFQFDKNNIVVAGQFYIKEDYPKGTYETEEQLSKAKVFRYTDIKIVDKHH